MSTSPRRYTAAHLWLRPGLVFSPGELVVSAAGRVLKAGPIRRARVEHQAIFPGLVDAHVHLQIEPLPRARRSFLPWLRAVMGQMAMSDEPGRIAACRAAMLELLASGCTAVAEIDSTGLSPRALRALPLAGRCYQEVTGFHLGRRAAERLLDRREVAATRRCLAGFSPHAPYSVSTDLFRACARTGRALMVHVAECPEEVEFMRSGRGPFRDLLEELGRLPTESRPFHGSPVELLAKLDLLGPRCALVHCQELAPGDLDLIGEHGAPVVVCPGTIEYFRRRPVPLGDWLGRGMTIALGTDSRASNTGLSMLAEMARARRLWPELSPQRVLSMVTTAAGKAISRPSLGKLVVGGPADFIIVELGAQRSAQGCLEEFTHGRLRVLETFLGVGGKRG